MSNFQPTHSGISPLGRRFEISVKNGVAQYDNGEIIKLYPTVNDSNTIVNMWSDEETRNVVVVLRPLKEEE